MDSEDDDLALFRNLFNTLDLKQLQLLLDTCLKNNSDHLNIVPFWHQIERILLPLVEIAKLDQECADLLETIRGKIETTAKELIELDKIGKGAAKAVEDRNEMKSLGQRCEQEDEWVCLREQIGALTEQIGALTTEFRKKSVELEDEIEIFIKPCREKLLVCIADAGRILPLGRLIHFHLLVYSNPHNSLGMTSQALYDKKSTCIQLLWSHKTPIAMYVELRDTYHLMKEAIDQAPTKNYSLFSRPYFRSYF